MLNAFGVWSADSEGKRASENKGAISEAKKSQRGQVPSLSRSSVEQQLFQEYGKHPRDRLKKFVSSRKLSY